MAPRGDALLAVAEERLRAPERSECVRVFPEGGRDAHSLADEYRRRAEDLRARYPDADPRRVDYTVLRDLAAARPHVEEAKLGRMLDQAMREAGAQSGERTGGVRKGTNDVEKMVAAALRDPRVREARDGIGRDHDDRGR